MAQVEQIVARSERAAALRALIDQQAHALFDELIVQAPVPRRDADADARGAAAERENG